MASPSTPPASDNYVPSPPSGGGAGRSKVLRFVGSLVVLLVLAGVGWYLSRDDAQNANVGDCLHEVSSDDLKIVKCDAADADVKVVGKVGGKTRSEAMTDGETVCQAYPDATSLLWWGESGKKGDVLCLQSVKP